MPRGQYVVFDMNQRGGVPRKHDVIIKFYDNPAIDPDVKTYELRSDKGTQMPMEHALKFLSDPSFKVMAPTGNRIMPVPKTDLSKPITKPADHEIVVSYEELSVEALTRRCLVLPGADQLPQGATKEQMVTFLVAWRASLRGKTDGQRQLEEIMAQSGFEGTMTEDMLEKMFPRARSTVMRRAA